MARTFASLACGLLFGLGLVISGMSDPTKILNFLDLAGTWDPSLMFVMGGAVAIGFFGFRLVLGRKAPLLDDSFSLPTRTDIDRNLVAGSAIFGLGWGLGGYCPGPAFTAITLGAPGTFAFIAAMIVGMVAGRFAVQRTVVVAAR